ncbi:hypothetical protein RCH10_005075 [Variovorax sp. GrIS 2.14]
MWVARRLEDNPESYARTQGQCLDFAATLKLSCAVFLAQLHRNYTKQNGLQRLDTASR